MTAQTVKSDDDLINQLSFNGLNLFSALVTAVPELASKPTQFVRPPLVVDLDGTLILTDTLIESFLGLLKSRPTDALASVLELLKGKAEFKKFVSEKWQFNAATLPYRTDLLDYIHEERKNGRRIVLATAASREIALLVADHLQIFDDVIASDVTVNLKGEKKLEAIRNLIGEDFIYAGDSSADLPIWHASGSSIIVDTSPSVTRQVKSVTKVEREFRTPSINLMVWLRALRCHQWVKNILLFVPVLTGLNFINSVAITSCALAFVAFCLAASGTYIGNDIWDIENDRAHPRKKNRPFASGQISVVRGIAVALALLVSSLVVASFVSVNFILMLSTYVLITTAYSWTLKRYVLIDVITLAVLYTFRVLAGSVATGLPMTYWLFAFSIFTFFSLALVKRCAELIVLKQSNKTAAHGRDYRVEDLMALYPLGIGASLCSVVVFGLYIGSAGARTQYSHPGLLWLAGVGLIYWVSRLWIKTVRGEMHDDPIVFALRDFGSRVVIIGMVAITLAAAYFE